MTVTLGSHDIDKSSRPFVIAEVSGNHNGDIETAKKIIHAAASAGADAVKLQTYRPDTMTIKSDQSDFQISGGLWDGNSLWDLYEWAHTPYEWHRELFEFCAEQGVTCFSTPFDETAVELLESLNCPFYKIASFELTDLPLIKAVAQTGKPMIMSTGMANEKEIRAALDCARLNGANGVVLLHCISGYPTPTEHMNLAAITRLADEMGCPVGLSDHSLDDIATVAAVALGAKVIEKHLTLRRADGGPDAEFSLEPEDFARLVKSVHTAHDALGDGMIGTAEYEQPNVKFRRSIYAVKPIAEGEIFTSENIRRIRPGYGLAPEHYGNLLGKKARRKFDAGDRLTSDDLIEG